MAEPLALADNRRGGSGMAHVAIDRGLYVAASIAVETITVLILLTRSILAATSGPGGGPRSLLARHAIPGRDNGRRTGRRPGARHR